MRVYKTITILLAALLLLLTVGHAAYAESDTDDGVEIFISEATIVYNASGEEIGSLSPSESGETIYYAGGEDDAGSTVRIFLQIPMSGLDAENEVEGLIGKSEIKIVRTTAEPEPEAENELQATETDTIVVDEPQTGTNDAPEVDLDPLETGWIDSDTVISALIQTGADRAEEVQMLQGEIGALQVKIDQSTLESNDRDAIDEAEATENATETIGKESTVDFLEIVDLILHTLIIAAIIWFIFVWKAQKKQVVDKEETPRIPTKVDVTMTTKLELPNDFLNSAKGLFEVSGQFIHTMIQRENDTRKQPAEDQGENQTKDVDIIKETLPTEEPKKDAHYQKMLNLVNQLSTKPDKDEWKKAMETAGFEFMLLDKIIGEEMTFKETQKESSYAAIWETRRRELSYLVPSYNDYYADRVAWRQYYEVKNGDDDKKKYEIEELAELSRQNNLFSFTNKGKMIYYKK